jgi:hypothetical protein
MNINNIIQVFDKQINQEFKYELKKVISSQGLNDKEIIKWKKDKKNLELCESYISKQIFLKSLNFNIQDWRQIRNGDYYNEWNLEKGINKKKYTLNKIEEYIKQLK